MDDRIVGALEGMMTDPAVAVRVAASAAMDRIRAKSRVPAYLERLSYNFV